MNEPLSDLARRDSIRVLYVEDHTIVAKQLSVSCRIADLSSVASPMPPPCLMRSISPLELTSSFSTGVFPMSRASICSLSCANPA